MLSLDRQLGQHAGERQTLHFHWRDEFLIKPGAIRAEAGGLAAAAWPSLCRCGGGGSRCRGTAAPCSLRCPARTGTPAPEGGAAAPLPPLGKKAGGIINREVKGGRGQAWCGMMRGFSESHQDPARIKRAAALGSGRPGHIRQPSLNTPIICSIDTVLRNAIDIPHCPEAALQNAQILRQPELELLIFHIFSLPAQSRWRTRV